MQDEISKQFVSGDEETLSQMTEKLDALKAGWLKEGYRRADFVWKYIQTKKLIQIAENHAIKDYEEIEIRKILENVYVAEEGYTVTFRNGLSVEV